MTFPNVILGYEVFCYPFSPWNHLLHRLTDFVLCLILRVGFNMLIAQRSITNLFHRLVVGGFFGLVDFPSDIFVVLVVEILQRFCALIDDPVERALLVLRRDPVQQRHGFSARRNTVIYDYKYSLHCIHKDIFAATRADDPAVCKI